MSDSTHRSARATEQRKVETTYAAVSTLIGPEMTKRLIETLEDALDDAPPEGPAAKLQRLQDSRYGRKWLNDHPDASWDDIARARV